MKKVVSKTDFNRGHKELQEIVNNIFPLRFLTDEKGFRHYAPYTDQNEKATANRIELHKIIDEHYDGTNVSEVKVWLTNRAKRIIIYNDAF